MSFRVYNNVLAWMDRKIMHVKKARNHSTAVDVIKNKFGVKN